MRGFQELTASTAITLAISLPASVVVFKAISSLLEQWLRNKSRRCIILKRDKTEVNLRGDISDTNEALEAFRALSQIESPKSSRNRYKIRTRDSSKEKHKKRARSDARH